MTLLARAIGKQTLAFLALFAALGCGLTWLLQAIRMGQHLAAAFSEVRTALLVWLYSAPTVIASILPFATLAATALACARLRASGELEAMRAVGAPVAQVLARGMGPVVMLAGLGAVALAAHEGSALGKLKHVLAQSSAASLMSRVESQHLNEIAPGLTLFLGERAATSGTTRHLHRILLAQGDADSVLVARRGTLSVTERGAELELEEGELHLPAARARGALRVRFERLRYAVPLSRWVETHLGFLDRIAGPTRPADLGTSCLGLALIGAFCFSRFAAWRALVAAGALVALVLAGARLATSLRPDLPTGSCVLILLPLGLLAGIGSFKPCRRRFASRPDSRG